MDKIAANDTIDSVVEQGEVMVSNDPELVDAREKDWIDGRSEPEVEQSNEQELTNLRVLDWHHDLFADPQETVLMIQEVDRPFIKYNSQYNTEFSWVVSDGPLCDPETNVDLLDPWRSTVTSMDVFVRVMGVGLTHTKNMLFEKLKLSRETGELEAEWENAKNWLLDKFLNYFLIFQITTQKTSLWPTRILYWQR